MSQKIENLLNLALDATAEERERSGELEVGYEPEGREWELIVKYSGDVEQMRETAVSVTELLNEYAIVVIKEEQIEAFAALPGVDFIEKPKSLYFQADAGRSASCVDAVQEPPLGLGGRGVLVGVIDSGLDIANPDFRREDGTTRLVSLWDQSVEGNPPEGYERGGEYTAEEIDRLIKDMEEGTLTGALPGADLSGHGTAVAGIAAGNGRGSEGGRYRGVAPEADLIVVKMGAPRRDGFPRTTELMLGVDYVIRKARILRMPVAVNISFGNTYGSHDGTSLVERFLNDIADTWKNVICVGSGNEGAAAGHTSGQIGEEEEVTVEFAVQEREPSLNLQLWKSYVDEMDISIVTPSGERVGPLEETPGSRRYLAGGTELLIYYGEPKPYSVKQEIYFSFLPVGSYVDSGVWKILLEPRRIVDGIYQMWLPSQSALNVGTAFLRPVSAATLTIPSTASLVVTVGAYDARTLSYADFSGRGPTGVYEGDGSPKPDLAAPGVGVNAPVPGGGYRSFDGTSFAVPFVTGSAALMMEYAVVRGNDPYLYGEKVKAYLRRGARELPGYSEWPNAQLGYGALCVRDSLLNG